MHACELSSSLIVVPRWNLLLISWTLAGVGRVWKASANDSPAEEDEGNDWRCEWCWRGRSKFVSRSRSDDAERTSGCSLAEEDEGGAKRESLCLLSPGSAAEKAGWGSQESPRRRRCGEGWGWWSGSRDAVPCNKAWNEEAGSTETTGRLSNTMKRKTERTNHNTKRSERRKYKRNSKADSDGDTKGQEASKKIVCHDSF